MVARILKNPKYTGADNYPKLVDIKLFEAAAVKRQTKQCLPERTPAQKALRRICTKPPTPEIEQQVTHLLGRLVEQPERITQPTETPAPTHTNTQAELDEVLNTQPLDEDAARSLICKLAQEQYDTIGNEEYETERLRRLFAAFECTAELNAELLIQRFHLKQVQKVAAGIFKVKTRFRQNGKFLAVFVKHLKQFRRLQVAVGNKYFHRAQTGKQTADDNRFRLVFQPDFLQKEIAGGKVQPGNAQHIAGFGQT